MFEGLRRRILGIPAGYQAAAPQQAIEAPLYLPESVLRQQVNADAENVNEWVPWRTDPDGELWWKRTTADDASSEIHGIAPAEEPEDFEGDELSDDEYTAEVMARFNRECGILQSRYERGEIGDQNSLDETFDEDFGGDDDEV